MNFCKISHWDTANGVGIGLVLWVSGCPHHCEGCHNYSTWDASVGQEFTKSTMEDLIKWLSHPHVNRITLSGGDPLAVYNRATILSVVKEIKTRLPNKKIWCYTGYNWDDVKDLMLLKYVDILVDGKFIQEQKDVSLRWCGSRNQRVIDVQKSLMENQVVLLELPD